VKQAEFTALQSWMVPVSAMLLAYAGGAVELRAA